MYFYRIWNSIEISVMGKAPGWQAGSIISSVFGKYVLGQPDIGCTGGSKIVLTLIYIFQIGLK